MNTNRVIFALVALLSCLSSIATADEMPTSLKSAYASVEKALAKLDFKTFSSFFDADFVLVDPAGKAANRSEFLAMVKPMFQGATSAKQTMKVRSVSVLGDYVEVGFILDIEIRSKQGTTRIHEEGTDSLVLKNGKWVLYRCVQDKFTFSEAK